jgi:hypothetical protein
MKGIAMRLEEEISMKSVGMQMLDKDEHFLNDQMNSLKKV